MTRNADLRTYITALEAVGEVRRISQSVALDLEIGAITQRVAETGQALPLFENIAERPGMRVLGLPDCVSSQPDQRLARIAIALGLPACASGRQVVEAFAAARAGSGVAPTIVETGPCKQNVLEGDDVDLLKLPALLPRDGDDDRFLNTVGVVCCETPDKAWRSCSIARVTLVDGKRLAGYAAPNQHIAMVHKTWADLGKEMPFALVIGAEPVLLYVAVMALPDYASEVDYAGALTGRSIDVVYAETVDVLVPAAAEIVIEGFLSRAESDPESSTGESAGFFEKRTPHHKFMCNITAITHRDDPILPVSLTGESWAEPHQGRGIPAAGEVVALLRKHGFPVATAWSPFESAKHWFVVAVSLDWRRTTGLTSCQLCQRLGKILFTSKAGTTIPKCLVVDDDIDITRTSEVVWAFAARNQPGIQGELVYDNTSTSQIDAAIHGTGTATFETVKVIYDCLHPGELDDAVSKRRSFGNSYPPALQQKILANWAAYGYPSETTHAGSRA